MCVLLASCASPQRAEIIAGASGHWQGRLAVKVIDPVPKAFAANFEMQGDAKSGQLTLTSPLGTTLANIEWAADFAQLTTTGSPQRYESMQSLALSALGVDVPITQLFDWFSGNATEVSGWEVDLREFAAGRVTAKRIGPDLQAELKILFER
jgi:outer membrane lipoprotein LolB